MRVLLASTGGAGHFGPLLPFARALRDAGHEVAVAAPASFADDVAAAGLPHRAFDDVPPDVMGAVFAEVATLPVAEADNVVVRDVFGRLDAQAAFPGVRATLEDWRPDLVVREPCELGSLAAAEAVGVPHAAISIGMTAIQAEMAAALDAPLAELDAIAGLTTGRCSQAFASETLLSSVPAGLDTVLGEPAWPVRRFRVDEAAGRASLPPAWGDPDAPLVYVTFGSVTGRLGHQRGVYARTVEVLADAPYRVLLTTGSGLDPAELGPPPGNTHVEPWWPQSDVMPAVAAMVGHGGFGTTMTAVVHGVPQVVVPLFSFDQSVNAAHVAASGAGLHLDGGVEGIDRLPEALAGVLQGERHREAATALAAEVAALPPAADAVDLLEGVSRRAAGAR